MTKIHMETDQVRLVASSLNQKVDDLLDCESALKRAASKASSAWYGSRRATNYHKGFKSWLTSYKNQIAQLENLVLRLSREANEWEIADRSNNWDKICLPPPVMNANAISSLPTGGPKKFDWYKPSKSLTEKVLEILDKVPYDSTIRGSWKGLGRWVNEALEKNLKAGWVGKMDRLGHIVRSPAVQKGAPFALGVVGEFLKGDHWDRALGSEAIETAAEWGLPMAIGGAIGGIIGGVAGAAAGGVGAIPGAMAGAATGAKIGVVVYKAYQGVLAAASIFSGMLEVSGNSNEAIWLQNTIDKYDFGENIGNGVYDGIYNYATQKVSP